MPPHVMAFNQATELCNERRFGSSRGCSRRFLVAHEIACEMIDITRANARASLLERPGWMQLLWRKRINLSKVLRSLPPEYVASTMKFVNALEAFDNLEANERDGHI